MRYRCSTIHNMVVATVDTTARAIPCTCHTLHAPYLARAIPCTRHTLHAALVRVLLHSSNLCLFVWQAVIGAGPVGLWNAILLARVSH